MKCLEKNPKKRYQSVEEIINEVDRYSRGFSTQAEAAGFSKQLQLLYRRNTRMAQTAVLALLVIVSLTSYFISHLNKEKNAAQQARDKAEQAELQAVRVASELQQEKRVREHYAATAVKTIFTRMAVTWRSGDSFNLEQIKEMANSCLLLVPENPEALYNLGHVALCELDFNRAARLYRSGSGRVSDKVADFCEGYAELEQPLTDPQAFKLSQFLLKNSLSSLHRLTSRKVLEGRPGIEAKLKTAQYFFALENRSLRQVSLVKNYTVQSDVLALRKLSNLDLRIVSLLPLRGLDLSGSKVILYPYRQKIIHYEYLNFRGSNIAGLPFSGKKLKELHLSSVKSSLSFLKECSLLEEVYVPKGLYKKSKVLKYLQAQTRLVEY